MLRGRRRIPDLVARLPDTEKALGYAERMHAGQRRAVDGAPFILHPIEVASLLYYAGAVDRVIAAGALHDVIEKTTAKAADVRRRFGQPITTLVLAVTDDAAISDYERRKTALREQVAAAGHEALMVFAADKISKVRELRLGTAGTGGQPATSAPPDRERHIAHYHECLLVLERLLHDSPLVSQLRTEFEMLPGAPKGQPLLVGAAAS